MRRIAFAIAAILSVFIVAPASAQVVITQAKALAGNITPGDAPGYPISLLQPGAYVLGSNLTVPSGTYGIYAGVDNIDVDFNGFTISGGGVATYGFVSSKARGRIHDGAIQAFKSSGIYLRGDAWTIENMQVVQNGGLGIDANTASLIDLRDSLVAVNKALGIVTGDIGYFRDNRIVNNASSGISCEVSCHAEGNLVDLNKAYGISFVSGMVIGNTITRNSFYGLADISGAADTGYSNNMFVDNYASGSKQVSPFATPVHPNNCVGNPC